MNMKKTVLTLTHFKTLTLLLLSTPIVQAQEQEQALELDTIVVTAPLSRHASDIAAPVTVLSEEDLQLKTGHSIGETLKNELGMSNQSFGPGVGTPVIRGQAGPRVRVLSNGIGSGDVSAISPDHATSTEALLAERIEVLRGPATLLYGSGAVGGVVNVLDGRIPNHQAESLIGGALEQRFDSTSDETATALKVEGGQGHLAYHLDGFFRERNDLSIGGHAIDVGRVAQNYPELEIIDNPRGQLNNTGAQAISGSAGFSWVNEKNFFGGAINNLNNNYQIAPDGSAEGERVSIHLRQNKYDFKNEWQNPLPFISSLRSRFGYTDYQHSEIADDKIGALFTNESYEARAELEHQPIGILRGVVGFQAQSNRFLGLHYHTHDEAEHAALHPDEEHEAHEEHEQASENPMSVLVPRSQMQSYGVFMVESFDTGAFTHQFGTRVEQTDIDSQAVSGLNYTPVSASASTLWKIDKQHQLNLAFTRSARAPQIQELLSDGFHHATRSWERGDLHLQEESSYNLDFGYHFTSKGIRAQVDVFHNWANDYIHQARTGEFLNEEGEDNCDFGCVPVLQSTQKDALFKGYEAKLTFTLMENHQGDLDLTLFSDYTRGEFASGGDVPRMPPLRYGFEVDYGKNDWSSYVRLTYADKQTHVGEFETATDDYFLLNVGANYRLKTSKDTALLLFAKGNNLLDENIRNATSYLRSFAPEAGRGAEIGFRLSY